MKWGIKFRPINPHAPHLNGQVERTQRTDLEEFNAIEDFNNPNLEEKPRKWQHYCKCLEKIPSVEIVCADYDPEKERFRLPNNKFDLELGKLK